MQIESSKNRTIGNGYDENKWHGESPKYIVENV